MRGTLAIWVGATGATVAALCCFTAFLPIVLGGLGFSGLLGVLYRDAVLLPLLFIFLLILGYGLWTRARQS